MHGGGRKMNTGRGGDGRGRGGQGRQGRGPGANRGVVRQPGPPQFRLFYLKTHLVLRCFDYLNEASRKNVFGVMGWPMDNYFRRKDMMIKQLEHVEMMKKKRLEEQEKAKNNVGNEGNDGVEANEPETKSTGGQEDDKNNVAPGLSNGHRDPVSFADLRDLNKLTMSVNVAWDDVNTDGSESMTEIDGLAKTDLDFHGAIKTGDVDKENNYGDVNAGGKAEGDSSKSGGKDETGDEVTTEKGGEGGAETSNEESITPEKEILPPLFARTDPDTLLSRLNTRRLYQRILYYKRKERKKLQVEMDKMLSENGDELRGTIVGLFEQELKDKMTIDRVYRKNMTIQEMADKEWDELIEMAELRINNETVLHEPFPTQYELLLFSPCPRAVGILASYPRSGNSLMRTLYEHTTLRVTGSDMQGGLAKHDLVGEMAVGVDMVQFVKTHYPERQGTPPFHASRVVLLVRNPFDAIESFFNLMMTGQHTASITPEVRAKTLKHWEDYVLKEIRVWKGFHLFWMRQDIPMLLIRYEDLIRQPDQVMSRVLQFVLEVQRMGTFFTERIDRCIREQAEIERMGSYKPRSGGIGKSLSKYSPELLNTLKNDAELVSIMGHLGYSDLLVTPPEEWATKLEPLKDCATEFLPTWHNTRNQKVVLLNRGKLARGPNEVTQWQKMKFELGIIEKDCDCEKCRALKMQRMKEQSEGGDEQGTQAEDISNADVVECPKVESSPSDADADGEQG